MMRFIALTVVAVTLLAVFVYGVVLNGFDLIADPHREQVAESTPAPAPESDRTADASPERGDAGSANGAESGSDPGVAGRGAAGTKAGTAATDTEDDPQSDAVEPVDPTGGDPSEQPLTADTRIARDVTPPNVLARPTSRYIDPAVLEAAKAEEEEEKPDIRRYHRVIVEDAATLKSGDKTIRLAGVSPAAADKTCTDEAGQTWPCGRVAAAALRMLIRHRAIDCTVVSEFDDEIVGNCSAGLQDINGWLVEQGWAEADPGAGYGEEADAARAEKRGIYLAKWEVKGKGGSGVVPQSSFTAPALPSQPYSSIPAAEPAPSGEATVQGPAN